MKVARECVDSEEIFQKIAKAVTKEANTMTATTIPTTTTTTTTTTTESPTPSPTPCPTQEPTPSPTPPPPQKVFINMADVKPGVSTMATQPDEATAKKLEQATKPEADKEAAKDSEMEKLKKEVQRLSEDNQKLRTASTPSPNVDGVTTVTATAAAAATTTPTATTEASTTITTTATTEASTTITTTITNQAGMASLVHRSENIAEIFAANSSLDDADAMTAPEEDVDGVGTNELVFLEMKSQAFNGVDIPVYHSHHH